MYLLNHSSAELDTPNELNLTKSLTVFSCRFTVSEFASEGEKALVSLACEWQNFPLANRC